MNVCEKVAMYVALIMCALIIFVGIAIWFAYATFMQKLIISVLCIGAGISMGSLGIYLLKEES